MSSPGRRSTAFRFGVFELDPVSRELRKQGIRIKLQEQPLQILLLLLQHAGEVLTREQIQNEIWSKDTFVDFDNAINSAVRKLRDALGDKAENPRFVETVARRGYRFIAPVAHPSEIAAATPPLPVPVPEPAIIRISRRQYAVRLTLAACVAAVVMWVAWKHSGAPTVDALRVSSLTGASGVELHPSLSPDGTRVAYAWLEPDQKAFSAYVKLIGPGDPVPIANGLALNASPVWSPDGRWIAVLRDLGCEASILVIPASGGQEREITRIPKVARAGKECLPPEAYYSGSWLTWSMDSKFLFSSAQRTVNAPLAIVRVAIDSGDQQFVTDPRATFKGGDTGPAVSPDGRALAFVRSTSFRRGDLYVVPLSQSNLVSGEPRRITSDNTDVSTPAWTANGRELIFSSDRGGRRQLWRVHASASSSPVPVLGAGEDAADVAVGSRGGRLVYGRTNSFGAIWKMPVDPINGKPGEPIRIAETTARVGFLDWSPDGSRIVFQFMRTGVNELWLCNADGSNMVQLTSFDKGSSGSPRWSPDGRMIAFDSNAEGGWEIYVVRSSGGRPIRLTTGVGNIVPDWSRDGQWIYYTAGREQSNIWKIHPDGSSNTQVTTNGGALATESADGKYLYYKNPLSTVTDIWQMPLPAGRPSKVLDGVTGRLFPVTEHGIFFLAGHAPPEIRFFKFSNKTVHFVAGASAGNLSATVSRDAKWLLYSRNAFWGSNLMVVDNFH